MLKVIPIFTQFSPLTNNCFSSVSAASGKSKRAVAAKKKSATAKPKGSCKTRVSPQPLRADIDKVMRSPSIAFSYVPTKLGPGRVSVNGAEYIYHFKSNSVNFWRCAEPTCEAKVITKGRSAWNLNTDHNH